MILAEPGSSNLRMGNDWRFAVIGLMALLVFASFTYVFQYRDGFAEYDIYWVMTGLLDGATTGLRTSSPMQYLITVSFGFYETFYALFDLDTLRQPAILIARINSVGWVSAIVSVVALWIAVSFVEGSRTATIVAVLFSFGAAFLEASTSGHPFLLALALLFIGACFLWAPVNGIARIACSVAATLFLAYSLSVRADGVLVFPWLLLARADLQSWRAFILTTTARAVPLVVALAIFASLQSLYAGIPHGPQAVQGGGNALVDFMRTFYQPSRVGVGIVYIVLSAGIATAVAALIAALMLLRQLVRESADTAGMDYLRTAISAAALLIPNLIFWLPNPSPARHFCLTVIVFGLLIATAARMLRLGPALTAGLLLALVCTNEILSEAARPLLLARITAPPVDFGDARQTHPLVPIGFIWRHHQSMQSAADVVRRNAERLAQACNPKVILKEFNFAYVPPYFSAERPRPILKWYTDNPFFGLTIIRGSREVLLAGSFDGQLDVATLEKKFPGTPIVAFDGRPPQSQTPIRYADPCT